MYLVYDQRVSEDPVTLLLNITIFCIVLSESGTQDLPFHTTGYVLMCSKAEHWVTSVSAEVLPTY